MRLLILAVTAAVLSGCSTPSMNEMRHEGPRAAYTSHKSEDAVSRCILFAWQEIRLAGELNTASIQPGREGGYTVTAHGNEYFADVVRSGGGVSVKYFAVGSSWISEKLQPAISSCL